MGSVAAARPHSKLNPDRVFFPVMCLLVLITVWLGFSKTYYAVGMVRAKLPSPTVHIHAVVFTLWLLTLVVQTMLVSARKVKLHMTLGLWGFGLAAGMVALGSYAAVESLRRGLSPPGSGLSPLTFFVIPLSDMLMFSVLAGWSYARRRKPDAHKRLIMIATIVLLDAAIGRFPHTIAPMGPLQQTLIFFSFLVVIMVYDLVTLKKIHRATWAASLFVVAVTLTRIPFAQGPLWQHFAGWLHG